MLPENKDGINIINEPGSEKENTNIRENKPIMNVISENDSERKMTKDNETLKSSESYRVKDKDYNKIIKENNNNNNSITKINKSDIPLASTIKKKPITDINSKDVSSPMFNQSTIKNVSNNSTLYKSNDYDPRNQNVKDKSKSPDVKINNLNNNNHPDTTSKTIKNLNNE